jgi:hypothetical protein
MAVGTTGAKVTKDSLKYAGNSYFRRNAPKVTLVSFGKKRHPVGQSGYVDVEGHIEPPKSKIMKLTTIDLEWDRSTSDEVIAHLSPAQLKLAGAEVSVARKLATTGELSLLMLAVEHHELETHINRTAKLLNELKESDNDTRLVTVVFVVLKAEIAETLDTSVAASAAVTIKGITLDVKGRHSETGTTKLEISAGSPFAYSCADIVWDKPSKRNRTKVEHLRSDFKGMA